MSDVRVRFAPSPTGHLHIGGARTALFNWLLARGTGGTFVLRIEDTDRARSTSAFEAEILVDLRWLGLDWDEGPEVGGPHGPYRQTERADRYAAAIDQLLENGHAYRCDCSADRLDALRAEQQAKKETPRYDGRCRDRQLGPDCGDHVVRFRAPREGVTVVDDLVKGQVEVDNAELDDIIIQRGDGTPIYNFVVVSDDIDMRITHVLRGDDHLNNTPKQILIYEALGAPVPRFAHVPLILGADGSRLSKRHGATSVGSYRDMGMLPEAMVNYLARLGWAHGDQEIFSLDELIAAFDVSGVGKSGAKWDLEKLSWLNQVWMKRLDPDDLAARVRPFVEALGLAPDARLTLAALTLRERARTLDELADKARVYFVDDAALDFDPGAVSKHFKAATGPMLRDLAQALDAVADWDQPSLEAAVAAFIEPLGLKLGKVAQPVRVAVSGQGVGPGLFETLEALGRDRAIRRIRAAVDRCPQ